MYLILFNASRKKVYDNKQRAKCIMIKTLKMRISSGF